MEDGVVSGALCRSTQFYAETVTTGSSTKNNKNLSCVGQAFQLVAMVLVEGRPGLGISGQVSHLMLRSSLDQEDLPREMWSTPLFLLSFLYVLMETMMSLFSDLRA